MAAPQPFRSRPLGWFVQAIGLGLMMGFTFMENFNHPYISRSITEFWQRWHISLSTWLRDYLYIPLGGNRRGAVRTYVNLSITMLLGGLWHGANWTFIVWGVWHGGLLALERRFTVRKDGRRVAVNITMPLTMLLVMLGWVVFRAENLSSAIDMYTGMVGLNGVGLSDALGWQLRGWTLTALFGGLIAIYLLPVTSRWLATADANDDHRKLALQLVVLPLFGLAVLRLFAQSYTPFLYFQF